MTVVVATRDRPELLSGALAALKAAVRPQDRVLVVDSASTNDGTQLVCRGVGVELLRLEQPGTSRARNAGVAASTTPLIAFTDDDCLAQSGWAAAIAAPFGDPAVGLVTGRVLPDREVPAPVSVETSTEARVFTEPVGHGASCCFRREALVAVGGFDEQLGPGAPGRAAEDADLMRRVLAAGWVGRYEPSAVVVHRQWRGRAGALRQSFAYGVGQVHAGAGFQEAVWRDALQPALRDARAGYVSGIAAGLSRAAGALRGLARR